MTKIESKEGILERRKKIEQKLQDQLKAMGKDESVWQEIRDAIYRENRSTPLVLIPMFGECRNASQLSAVLALVTEAWNYFPHEGLGGLSPAEKMLEYQNKDKPKQADVVPIGRAKKKTA